LKLSGGRSGGARRCRFSNPHQRSWWARCKSRTGSDPKTVVQRSGRFGSGNSLLGRYENHEDGCFVRYFGGRFDFSGFQISLLSVRAMPEAAVTLRGTDMVSVRIRLSAMSHAQLWIADSCSVPSAASRAIPQFSTYAILCDSYLGSVPTGRRRAPTTNPEYPPFWKLSAAPIPPVI